MTSVVPVKFAYAVRDLWFDQARSNAQEGDHVICATERGTEIGLVTAPARSVNNAELSRRIGNSTLKPVLRVASDADLAHAEKMAQKGDEAFPVFRRYVTQSGLDMKPVGVEFLFGGEKVVCYFAAEERVDFRQLVRDMSHELHQRIDMRQIGVREEAAVVGGFGHCGQELCCSRFGLAFEPVSIRMAKEQDLPLTSNKISGACGRLMCCLRYEFEAYRDFKGRAPKRNAVIDTPLGKAKVVEYDTPKEQLALRLENGKVVRIPLAEMVASEAAVKKSEELHCPCRPDTVVRASLDKLSSPDVQMALAELDRKMGVLKEETFDETDIFVETKSRKRRSRKRGADQGQAAEQVAAAPAKRRHVRKSNEEVQGMPQEEKKPRRRRRKRAGAAAGGDSVASSAPQAPKPTIAQQSMQKEAADERPKETRRRRRHRVAAVDAPKQQQEKKQEQPAKQQKPRRRPGDRGGQKPAPQPQAQAPAKDGASSGQRRRRRRRGGSGGTNGGGAATSE